ncbi:MAG: hypothetical protein IV100_15905 [Myxococcales bacterium]|nr:hypothetical protein [Myxococcales bacterium]
MKMTATLNKAEIEAAVKRDLIRKGHQAVNVHLTADVSQPDRPWESATTTITAEVEMTIPEQRDSDTLPEPMDEKTRAWALARAKACPDRSGE